MPPELRQPEQCRPELFRDPDTPVGGNPNGDVTLLEFFDYNFPYAGRWLRYCFEAVAADPRLRVVFEGFLSSAKIRRLLPRQHLLRRASILMKDERASRLRWTVCADPVRARETRATWKATT